MPLHVLSFNKSVVESSLSSLDKGSSSIVHCLQDLLQFSLVINFTEESLCFLECLPKCSWRMTLDYPMLPMIVFANNGPLLGHVKTNLHCPILQALLLSHLIWVDASSVSMSRSIMSPCLTGDLASVTGSFS